jgi:hypothetical protein
MAVTTFPIHQALALRSGDAEARWLGQSADFDDRWQPKLAELAVQFGPRPPGTRCPETWLALPDRLPMVVLARVQDLGPPDEAPAGLGFQFLLLHPEHYDSAGAEAFDLIAGAQACWHSRGTLPTLAGRSLARLRALGDVQQVLQRADSPLLLGAAQALLDGGRLALQREQPANDVISALWTLLPYRTRLHTSAATFAFGNGLDLCIVAAPPAAKGPYDYRYLSEAQAENYPEGRYELALQIAAEDGDERALHRLLLRRTRADTFKLGLGLLLGLVGATAVFAVAKLFRP